MIDLKRSLLIVSTFPSHSVDHRLLNYFHYRGLPIQNLLTSNGKSSLITGRNKVIKNIVLPRLANYDWFIFMDHDHYPEGSVTEGNKLDSFLEDVPYDVVGCTYKTGNEASWLSPDQFHMGTVRIRGEALARVAPPWFLFQYNKDGTLITKCECDYLRTKLLEAGCSITRRGYIGHEDSKPSWHTSG